MRFVITLLFLLSAQMVNALCVSAYQTRLRAEPSMNAKVTWVVGRYMPLLEKDRRGSWIKVADLDGEEHWVNGSEVTARERCVVVKSRQAALKQSPSKNGAPADIPFVDRFTAFKRLEAEPEDWYWVEDEVGGRFWIQAKDAWRPLTVNKVGF